MVPTVVVLLTVLLWVLLMASVWALVTAVPALVVDRVAAVEWPDSGSDESLITNWLQVPNRK